jgi:hypothetical protein
MKMHLPAGDLNDLDPVGFKNKRMGIRYCCIYTVNGNNFRFFTLTPTLSHMERELKEVAINGRSKYR